MLTLPADPAAPGALRAAPVRELFTWPATPLYGALPWRPLLFPPPQRILGKFKEQGSALERQAGTQGERPVSFACLTQTLHLSFVGFPFCADPCPGVPGPVALSHI